MKRVLLSIYLLWTIVASSQTVYWDFSTAAPATNGISGLTVSALSQGNNHGTTDLLSGSLPSSGYSGASGGNNCEAASFTGSLITGSPGSTYFEFTLTPQAGSIVKLEAISFGSRSTATGPTAYSLRTSFDSYSSDVASGSLSSNSVWTLLSNAPLSVASNSGTALTFRLYGYNGTGTTISNVPNWRIDDLLLTVTVTSAAFLPVRFGTVQVSETSSGIHLQWSNLTETDVLQYILERSSDGKTFYPIHQLMAIKNDGGKADYQLTDASPLHGNNFYRIKAVEKDDVASYSDIIRITIGSSTTSLQLFPVPLQGIHLQVQIDNLPKGIYHIRIYNSLGQMQQEQIISHAGGSMSQTLLLNNLKPGIYLLDVNGKIRLQKQFLVQP